MNGGEVSFYSGEVPLFQERNGKIISGNKRHVVMVGSCGDDRRVIFTMAAGDRSPTTRVFDSIPDSVPHLREFFDRCLGPSFEDVSGDLIAISLYLDHGEEEFIDDLESDLEILDSDTWTPTGTAKGTIYIEAESFDLDVDFEAGGFRIDEDELDQLKEDGAAVTFFAVARNP